MNKYDIKDFLEIKSSIRPSFSPDGKSISFLSNLSGSTQLYIIPTIGGEARQLTFYENSLSFAFFSPTKNEIIFGKDKDGDEMIQFYLLDVDSGEIKNITNKSDTKYQMGSWSRDGKYICYSSNERNGKDFDVYVLNIETKEKKCIYNDGGYCVAQNFSPNRRYIVFKKKTSPVEDNIYIYDSHTEEIKRITPNSEKVEYGSPRWLLDESGFYIITNLDKDFIGVALYTLDSNKFEYIFNNENDVDGITMSRNEKYLAVTENNDGYSNLTIYDQKSFKRIPEQKLPRGNVHSVVFSNDSSHLALSIGDARNTTNIWIWSINENKYWQLTYSPQGVSSDILIEPELIKYKSFDNLDIPAFIYKPNSIKENKLPTIIFIHGGPESQYRPNLSPLMQYFTYKGYMVIAPNIRGSSGYGKKYLALDDIEKRMDALKDVVELRKYLCGLEKTDPNKIVIMGGSYGGFITLAGLAFYPELWAAGIDIVGISNFITFLENTAPWRRSIREAEYGSLEKNREFLKSISPANFIENIKAPLFIIHGNNDPRVPLSETEQIANSLKRQNKEVELLVYPDEGHGLNKLKNKLDAYPKIIDFLEKVFKKEGVTPKGNS